MCRTSDGLTRLEADKLTAADCKEFQEELESCAEEHYGNGVVVKSTGCGGR